MLKKTIEITQLVFICFFFTNALSQEKLLQIENEYKLKTILDKNYYEVVAKYSQTLLINHKENEAFKVLQDNYKTAKKLNDIDNYTYLKCVEALQYFVIDDKTKSNASYNEAKNQLDKISKAISKGYVCYTGGWLARRNSNEIEAVDYFIKALKYYDSVPSNSKINTSKSIIYNELSRIYGDWNDFETHEKYTNKALEYALMQDEPDILFSAYMAVGYMYEKKLTENKKNEDALTLAEINYIKAIDIYKKNTLLYQSDLSYAALNLASIYVKYFPDSYLEIAKEYAIMAQEIAIANEEPNHLASAISILAEINCKKNEAQEAKKQYLEALRILEKSSSKDKNVELDLFEKLIAIEIELENYKEALEFQQEYHKRFKEIYNSEKLEISKRISAEYEKKIQQKELENLQMLAEKKENEIHLLRLLNLKKENDLSNLKLIRDNQEKKLKLSTLLTEKKQGEIQLYKLKTEAKNKDLQSFKEKLSFKDKLNTYYAIIIISIALILLLVLYLLKQRTLKLRNKEKIFQLALEKERQTTKITALTSLLNGQEKERERLARDLHDGLGGALSAIKLQLSDFQEKLEDKDNELSKIGNHLDFAITKLRKISHNLMPDIIIKYGLETAVKEFSKRMMNSNLEIHVHFLGYTKTLGTEKELFVYRIIQELVNNSIKHSKAKNIIIQVVEEISNFHITVEDDGIGFDLDKTNIRKSAGITNIQSRVQYLKGQVEIYSKINEGTTIEFNFPK